MFQIKLPLTGGVNLLDDPRRIADDEVVSCKNLVPVRPGVLATRPAVKVVAVPGAGGVGPPMVASFLPWPAGSQYFLYTYPVTAASGPTRLTAVRLDGSGSVNYTMGTYLSKAPWIVSLATTLYVLPAVDGEPVVRYVDGGGGTPSPAAFAFAGTGNSTIYPRFMTSYRNRAVWMNFGVGMENRILFSNAYDPPTVGNVALSTRAFDLVSTYDGDEIVGGVEVMLTATGSPAQAGLLVLRRYSSFLILGEPGNADGTVAATSDFAVNRMSVSAGLQSPWTIAQTPYGVVWAGPDDVWMFDTGQNPRAVGTKIRPALQRLTPDRQHMSRGAYFDGFYRVMTAGPGDAPSWRHQLREQWWLDMRPGSPSAGKWFGPQQFNLTGLTGLGDDSTGTSNFLVETRAGFPPGLFGAETSSTADVLLRAVGLVQYGLTQERDEDTLTNSSTRIDTVAGKAITIELLTKEYDVENSHLEKLFDGAYANVWVSRTHKIDMEMLIDGGYSSVAASENITQYGHLLDADVVETRLSRRTQPIAIYPDPASRPRGATFQARIYTELGHTIISDVNDSLIIRVNVGAGLVEHKLTVAAGHYATVSALITAINTAITAATTLTLSISGGGFVEAVDAGGTTEFIFSFQSAPTATAAQLRAWRILGSILGYDTSANLSDGGGGTLTAGLHVYPDAAPIVEFGYLSLTGEIIPREP